MLNCCFPHTKTLPRGSIVCFTNPREGARPSRRLPFWRGVWHHFRAWKCIGAQGCVFLAPGRPKVLHNALRDGPRCPKGLQKLAFRPPWATLLEQIGERVVFAKNILFIMFSSHRATPGLSTVALLTALDTECVPEPAFCVPWRPPVRPSVAAGRHREPNVTPNGFKKRPGDPQKSMKNPCCGLEGALGALGVSRGTPLAPKMLQNTVFPTLAEHLKEPCAHVVQQERVRKKMRWFRPPGTCFQKVSQAQHTLWGNMLACHRGKGRRCRACSTRRAVHLSSGSETVTSG